MRQDKEKSNSAFVWTVVIGSLLIVAMLAANTIWLSKRTSAATEEAVSEVSAFYLEAMADNNARSITNLISNSFDEMEKAVSFIADEQVESQEELREKIGKVQSLLELNRFALVDEENVVYTQYTTYTGGSRHPFLSDGPLNERIISTVSLYGSVKQLCLAMPTPGLTIMGKPFKACLVQFDISEIINVLAFDDQGRTHFALYSRNGGNLSGTKLGTVILDRNILDAIRDIVPEDVWKENCRNFEESREGNLSFALGDTQETLYYVPIQGTDWQLAVLIRESVIQHQIRHISERNLEASSNLTVFTLVSTLIFAAVLLYQVRRHSRARLEAEKETSRSFRNMANTDSMTGVRNKHAYTENAQAIDRQIASGELQELAVVVCDINGLKYVNDTQGHEAGDQLIKDACALICEQFRHGAVYRIGGDEFAVLLQGRGYNTMHETVAEMNRRVEENIHKNDVVVAIGYAVLGPEDRQLRDVFERADQMMYERKKELKAMGAQVSRF